MSKKAKFAIGLLAVLVLIQFIHPAKNTGSATGPNDISNVVIVSADVQHLLNTACNDCHSNHTEYPWYYNIQPVAWWLAHHVDEGKHELNFTEFKSYTLKRQIHKLDEVVEMVKENEMPLNSYTWMHKEAKLTQQQREILVAWADESRRALADTSLAMVIQ